jgi:hypothetical protein
MASPMRLLAPTYCRDPAEPLTNDLWWALRDKAMVCVSVDRWWKLGKSFKGIPVREVSVQVERRIQLTWRKDGRNWRQTVVPEQLAGVIEGLLTDDWEPSADGAAAFPELHLRHTPGDFLRKRYLRNGIIVQADYADGARVWNRVNEDGSIYCEPEVDDGKRS